jgi:hypothetical protein
MNKKILSLTMTVFTLAVMTLPMISTAQAARTKEPYYAEYGVMPLSPNTVDKTVGVVRIRSGAVHQGPYNGPLGTGTMTAELVIRIDTFCDTEIEKSVATFRNTLEITSGPFGAFTLEGSTHFKFDEEGNFWGKTKLQGMSELGQVTIIADKGYKSPPKPIWEEGYIIHP